MDVEQIVKKFTEKPYTIDMGAGKLSKWLGCSRQEIYEARRLYRSIQDKRKEDLEDPFLPKILILDIETAPIKASVWDMWKQNINPQAIHSHWFMLTWSAKWIFREETLSDRLTRKESLDEDDSRLVKGIWELIDEADIVVAHNGDRFDLPALNTRFLLNGLNPPSPYQSIDTLKIAKKQFNFKSNALNFLAKRLGFDPKLSTSFELWIKCINGDEEALAYMEEYNIYDVVLLENVYIALRPWMKSHPSISLLSELDCKKCTCCGSKNIVPKGEYRTAVSVFDTYHCNDCGSISRERNSKLKIKEKRNLLVNVAR